jgi:hypothetical protein
VCSLGAVRGTPNTDKEESSLFISLFSCLRTPGFSWFSAGRASEEAARSRPLTVDAALCVISVVATLLALKARLRAMVTNSSLSRYIEDSTRGDLVESSVVWLVINVLMPSEMLLMLPSRRDILSPKRLELKF